MRDQIKSRVLTFISQGMAIQNSYSPENGLPLGQYIKSEMQLELLQTGLEEDPGLLCPDAQLGGW